MSVYQTTVLVIPQQHIHIEICLDIDGEIQQYDVYAVWVFLIHKAPYTCIYIIVWELNMESYSQDQVPVHRPPEIALANFLVPRSLTVPDSSTNCPISYPTPPVWLGSSIDLAEGHQSTLLRGHWLLPLSPLAVNLNCGWLSDRLWWSSEW